MTPNVTPRGPEFPSHRLGSTCRVLDLHAFTEATCGSFPVVVLDDNVLLGLRFRLSDVMRAILSFLKQNV